jgi:hypothetical protein
MALMLTYWQIVRGLVFSILPLYDRTLILALVLVPWKGLAGFPFVDWIIQRSSSSNEKITKVEIDEKIRLR